MGYQDKSYVLESTMERLDQRKLKSTRLAYVTQQLGYSTLFMDDLFGNDRGFNAELAKACSLSLI